MTSDEHQATLDRAANLSERLANDPADVAAEILAEGTGHGAFRVLSQRWDGIVQALGDGKKQLAGHQRAGVGATEASNLVARVLLPAMEKYQDELEAVIDQIKRRAT